LQLAANYHSVSDAKKQECSSVNYRHLTQLATAVSLFALLLPQTVLAEDLPKPQTQPAEPTKTEVSKEAQEPAKQATFQVSTDKNMERKRGSLAIGLGLKRKGILLLPILHMKAQQPSLKEKATADSAAPAAD